MKMRSYALAAFTKEQPFAAVFWGTVGVALLGAALEAFIGYRAVGYLFLLFVLASGLFFSLGPVIFGAVLGATFWGLEFIPPRFSPEIHSAEDALLLTAFLATAACIGVLTTRLRRHQQQAEEQAQRAQLLYDCASMLVQGGASDEAVLTVLRRAGQRLDLRLGLLREDGAGALPRQALAADTFLLGASEYAQARMAMDEGKARGWERAGSYAPRLLALPLDLAQGPRAVLLSRRAEGQAVGGSQRDSLQALAELLSQQLQRRSLHEKAVEGEKLKASEALHQALFDSISHELRTPLTSLLASANALQGPAAADPVTRRALAEDLVAAAERLNRTVGNLLDSARLSAGRLQLRRDWHDPADLISACLEHLKPALGQHPVQLCLEPDLPLLHVDRNLIDHALANLLLNSAAYAPEGTPIGLTATRSDASLLLTITDHGPGIPHAFREKIFERFFRLPGSPAGGTGLGLHIARSLIRAHGGELRVTATAPGAAFEIRLPTSQVPAAMERA